MNRNSLSVWGFATILAVGCGQPHPTLPAEKPPFETTERNQLKVREDLWNSLRFEPVAKSDLNAEITAFGHLAFAPGASTAVRVPVDGYVESVNVDVGQSVKKNQLLAVVRSGELAKMRAEIRRITSELDANIELLNRNEPLATAGVVATRTLVELRSKVASLDAEKSGIRHALYAARAEESGDDQLDLRASRDGVIIARKLDPGEQVDDPENQPAFIIANPSDLIVRANFPERDAALLKDGFTCRVSVNSLGQASFPGKVSSVVRAIDPKSRTVEAVCKFDTVDPFLRAEMLARVTVQVRGEPRLLVPRAAVLLRRDRRVVFVRRGDHMIERREITTGLAVDSKLEVLSGLEAGDEVLVDGAVLLDGELDKLL